MYVAECKNATRKLIGEHSIAIVGGIDLRVGRKVIVLAMRELDVHAVENLSYSVFGHYLDHDHILYRSWAQSAKNTEFIAKAWLKTYQNGCQLGADDSRIMQKPSITDLMSADANHRAYLLRVYVELSAKHWGDLGLILDALIYKDLYVVTIDRPMIMLCCSFGAAHYDPPPTENAQGTVCIPNDRARIVIAKFVNNIFDFIRLNQKI